MTGRGARVNQMLSDLAECLCSKITENDLPPVCYCGVIPGDAVALDYVGNCDGADGMAWVRLALVYPAARVGQVDTTLRNCSAGLGIEIEIGIVRTAPPWEEAGEPPTEAANLAGSELMVEDMATMMQAVVCCNSLDDYILGSYRPQIMGMALGGTFTVMTAI